MRQGQINNQGVAELVAILVILVVFVVAAAGSFYFLKSQGRNVSKRLDFETLPTVEKELPVSDSDKTTAIEAELESTLEADFSSDIEELEKDASSL